MVGSRYFALQSILDGLFDIFVYTPDIARFGVIEHWANTDESISEDGKLRGDCDDFAIAAWRRTRDAGYSPRLIECELNGGGHHLICEVDGYVLDNRFREVMTRQELTGNGYRFLKISGYAQDEPWTEVV